MRQRMTVDDFLIGFFATLKLKGFENISLIDDKFDYAFGKILPFFKENAEKEEIYLNFDVIPHYIHGDSVILRDSITRVAQRDIISLDNPTYMNIRIIISENFAEKLLNNLVKNKNIFYKLIDDFLKNYYELPVSSN